MEIVIGLTIWFVCIAGLGAAQVWIGVVSRLKDKTKWNERFWGSIADCNLYIFAISLLGGMFYTIIAALLALITVGLSPAPQSVVPQSSVAGTSVAPVPALPSTKATVTPPPVNSAKSSPLMSTPTRAALLALILVVGIGLLFLCTSGWSIARARTTTGADVAGGEDEVLWSVRLAFGAMMLAFAVEHLK